MRHSSHSSRNFSNSSDSDAYIPPDENFSANNFTENDENTNAPIIRRHSDRIFGHSISYNELENDYSSELEEEEELDPIFGNERINQIYLCRQLSSQNNEIEYLVDFQEASDIFAHWFSADILDTHSTNFPRSLQKFNETEMKLHSYTSKNQNNIFNSSFRSPVHIISHRPMNNDLSSKTIEYLYQFDLETGTPFVWEPDTTDSPHELISEYLEKRVCVENTHPERPKGIDISYDESPKFQSTDGFLPKSYQIDGVNWMLQCFCSNHGSILADEMGLGKTIQSLMFLMRLNTNSDFHGPHLIAVRTNTFTQWCSEIERWCDLKYIAYNGSKEIRDIIREYQIPYFDENGIKIENKYGFNILLVTYDIFMKDVEYLKNIDWQVIMLDEGHRIKNIHGKKHNALVSIPSLHRVILTGTPIQSTVLELWALLNFVSPYYFEDSSMFPEDDVESLDDAVVQELRELIAPHLMRRSLLDTETSIIPKDERIAFLHLTEPQQELIRLTKLHELWRIKENGDDTQSEPNMLQRICNHPFLINGTQKYYQGRYKLPKLQLLINCSAKFIFLDRILPIFKKAGRSVLIFSQRLKILNLLSEYCKLKKYSHELLMGSLTENQKKEAISRFSNKDKDVFIFLISTKSGSEGLNLTKASITIIFDPDWNPQNDLQALGRCHRIGQTQKVDVIRLLTYGTYEHEMFARAQRKLRLWDTLLGEGTTTDPSLAQKCKSKNAVHDVTALPGNLMGNSAHHNIIELEGILTDEVIRETTQEINDETASATEFPVPPLLTSNYDNSLSFEEMLETSATVVNDIQLVAQQSRHFPELDLSFGLTDEQFLKKFEVDPGLSAQNEKKKNRMMNIPRVQLDPKSAKRIIKFLEIHGYGEWESIHSSMKELCSLEQITHFCQAATILHLRAIDPELITSFPLLLQRLQNDLPKFEISHAMNNDISEWYSLFSKRSYLVGEANVCKQISNYIHNTALSFLAHLENHLLVSEWIKDDEHVNFPFEELPIDPTRTRDMDVSLYESLIDRKTVSGQDDQNRIAQILTVMRSQLLLRKVPIETVKIPFWTKGEICTILSCFRNYGEAFLSFRPRIMHSKTALLSKDDKEIEHFSRILFDILSKRFPNDKSPIVIPDEITQVSVYTEDKFENGDIVIEYPIVIATIKRILLMKFVKLSLKFVETKKLNMDKVMASGRGWCTLGNCLMLLQKISENGLDSLVNLVLSNDLPFRKHLTADDIDYLKTFNKNSLKEDSKLPVFLINENKFYMFLKMLSGNQPKKNPPNQPPANVAKQVPAVNAMMMPRMMNTKPAQGMNQQQQVMQLRQQRMQMQKAKSNGSPFNISKIDPQSFISPKPFS